MFYIFFLSIITTLIGYEIMKQQFFETMTYPLSDFNDKNWISLDGETPQVQDMCSQYRSLGHFEGDIYHEFLIPIEPRSFGMIIRIELFLSMTSLDTINLRLNGVHKVKYIDHPYCDSLPHQTAEISLEYYSYLSSTYQFTIDFFRSNFFSLYFISSVRVSALICHSSCLSCQTEFFCLSCFDHSHLGYKSCICDQGYYNATIIGCSDGICYKCLPCHETCLSCFGSLETECSSCNSPRFIFNNQCIMNCPIGYYENSNEKKCFICNLNCYKCKDLSDKCIECITPLILQSSNNKCVEKCFSDQYIDNNQCVFCKTPCISCDKTRCFKCETGYQIINNNCEPIKTNICLSPNVVYFDECLTDCPISYFNKSGNCELRIQISIKIRTIDDKNIFLLDFNENWNELAFYLNQNSSSNYVLFTDINKNDFSTSLIVISDMQLKLSFYFYKTLEIKNYRFKIYFTSFAFENKILITKELEGSINIIGENQKINFHPYLFIKQQKYPIFLSFKTNDEELIILKDYPQLFNNNLINYLFFKIENFNNYIISIQSIENNVYSLQIDVKSSMIGSKLLNMTIDLDSNLKENQNFTINPISSSIYLPDIYTSNGMSNSTKEMSQSITNTLTSTSQIGSVLGIFSLVTMRFALLVDLLKFYKYVKINYPINMMDLFDSKLNLLNSINLLDIPEPDPDPNPTLQNKFDYYNISKYFWNNSNLPLVQISASYLIGIFMIFCFYKLNCVKTFIKSKKENTCLNEFFRLVLQVLYKLVIWNFIIAQFLSNFNENTMYCFLTFKWPPLNNEFGKINFILALIVFLLLIVSLIFLGFKIRSYLKKNSKIYPQNITEIKSPFEDLPKINVLPPEITFETYFDLRKPKHSTFSIIILDNNGFPVIPWEKIQYLENGDENFLKSPKTNKLSKIPISSFQKKLDGSTADTSNYISPNSPSPKLKHSETKKKKILKNRYFVLFNEVKRGRITSFFMLIELIRQFILSFLLVILYDYGLVGAVSVFSLNLCFFIIFLIIKPCEKKKDFYFGVICEFGLNLGGLICLILAILDYKQNNDEEIRMILGWIFVGINWILIFITMTVYIIELIKFLFGILKMICLLFRKESRKKIQRKTINDKLKETVELNNFIMG